MVQELSLRRREKPQQQIVLEGMIRPNEQALFKGIERKFPERVRNGWTACGVANLTLSRMLNAQFGLPIHQGRGSGNLELKIGVYDNGEHVVDQTYMLFHPKDNSPFVWYIDPIYRLGFQGRSDVTNATIIERLSADSVDDELASRFHLFPLQAQHPGVEKIRLLTPHAPDQVEIDDMQAIMNDNRALLDRVTIADRTYNLSGFWGQPLRDLIGELVPDRTRIR